MTGVLCVCCVVLGLFSLAGAGAGSYVSFPVYVNGRTDPLMLQYNDNDLQSSAHMGALCGGFVRSHMREFGMESSVVDMKNMATSICKAIAEQSSVSFEYDPNDFYLKSVKESKALEPVVSVANVLQFARDGWTVVPNALPEIKEQNVLKNVNETLKRRKFEYVTSAFDMARRKWNIDPEETRDKCGNFNLEYLNEHNLGDDETAEQLYRYGIGFLLCTMNIHIVGRPKDFIYVPFNQVMNIHRINDVIYDIATSRRMGSIAAELLQHDTVRLYQTALFSKDNFGINIQTEWHRDLNMAPVHAKQGGSLTFWCPVNRNFDQQDGDSMLRFLAGSHRDISQKIWYNGVEDMESRYGGYEQARRLNVGDCTVHHGWVLHYATPQPKTAKNKNRLAIGFTYVAGDATVLTDLYRQRDPMRRGAFGDEDEDSYRDWLKDLKEGDIIDHPLLPLVYDSQSLSNEDNDM